MFFSVLEKYFWFPKIGQYWFSAKNSGKKSPKADSFIAFLGYLQAALAIV